MIDASKFRAALQNIAPTIELPALYDNLTQHQRAAVRSSYAMKQDNKCSHCGTDLEDQPAAEIVALRIDSRRFPKGFFDHPVHLHHSHDTGLTIGAVHARCNAVLWQYHGQ